MPKFQASCDLLVLHSDGHSAFPDGHCAHVQGRVWDFWQAMDRHSGLSFSS